MKNAKRKIPVAEMYELSSNYTRFDQKNSIMIQSFWNDKYKQLTDLRNISLENLRSNNEKGYAVFDYSYYQGAMNLLNSIDYGLHFCDQKANSWSQKNRSEIKNGLPPIEEVTSTIKSAALKYGASAVGITKLDRRWVYSDWYDNDKQESYPIIFSDEDPQYNQITEPTLLSNGTRVIPAEMKYVIVILDGMDMEALQYAPTLLAYAETIKSYGDLATTTLDITGFIKAMGYQAIPSLNCTALNIPLAIDAGLGELGRHGKLINPELGSRVRIAKVFTNLPLIEDEPNYFGVTEFCETCKKCARECPGEAIPTEDRKTSSVDETGNNNYFRWVLDHKRCYEYWSECGTNCSICIYVCPYNRGERWANRVSNFSIDQKRSIQTYFEEANNIDDFGDFDKDSDEFWKKKE